MNLNHFFLKNGIPEAIRDPKQLTSFLRKYSIIPYYGNAEFTSHNVLQLIADLCELSPSHTACKKDLKSWSFGNELDLQSKVIPGLYLKNSDLSESERIAFASYLMSIGINLFKLLETIKITYSHLMDSGNAWLYVKETKIGNSKRFFIDNFHFTQCAYSALDLSKVIVCTSWDEATWRKLPPKVFPVSQIGEPFNFKETKNTRETVIHIWTNKDNSDIYGRPNILSALRSLLSEYNMLDLQAKISGTEFSAKTLLAFEEVDPVRITKTDKSSKDIFNEQVKSLRKIATQEGEEPKSLAAMSYPFGGKPPTSIDLTMNRDTEYNRWSNEMNISAIYGVNGWSRELSGQAFVRSNVGQSILRDQFITKNLSTIKPIQIFMENIIADIFYNTGISTDKTIKFRDLIAELALLTQDKPTTNVNPADNTPKL